VIDSQFARDISEPRVGRPQCHVRHKGRREEVRIDPSDTTPVKAALANELDDLAVRHDRRLVHERRIDKNHQEAERVDAALPSRRRRTPVARGSFPRRARSRS
jgi:hypothetical protein